MVWAAASTVSVLISRPEELNCWDSRYLTFARYCRDLTMRDYTMVLTSKWIEWPSTPLFSALQGISATTILSRMISPTKSSSTKLWWCHITIIRHQKNKNLVDLNKSRWLSNFEEWIYHQRGVSIMAQGILPFKYEEEYEEEKRDTGLTGLVGLLNWCRSTITLAHFPKSARHFGMSPSLVNDGSFFYALPLQPEVFGAR